LFSKLNKDKVILQFSQKGLPRPKYIWTRPTALLHFISFPPILKFIRQQTLRPWCLSFLSLNQTLYTNHTYLLHLNPLKTKRRLIYLKTQFVPRSKHFSSRL